MSNQLIKIRQIEGRADKIVLSASAPLCLILQAQKLVVLDDGQTNFTIQYFPWHPDTQVKMTINGEYYFEGESFTVTEEGRITWTDERSFKTTDEVFVEYLVNINEIRTDIDYTDEDIMPLTVDGEAVVIDVDGELQQVFIERVTGEDDKYYIRVDGHKIYLKFSANDNRFIFV